MARSTKTQRALNVNAAHGLLSRGVSVTEAAAILARERGLSLRQAYRYVESARTIARALPVGEPSVPATFKIPRDVLAQLRTYSASSGLSLSAIVARALKRCLTVLDRDRSTSATWLSDLQSLLQFVWNSQIVLKKSFLADD